jgi:protein-disulfide isomerase
MIGDASTRPEITMQMIGIRLPATAMAALLALGVVASTASAQQNETLTDQGKIEQTIRDYLLAHPEVIVEALEKYQAQQEKAAAEQQARAIAERREELARAPDTPVLGNPDGDIAIVEFFDYRCPYCKSVAGSVVDLVEADGNIRFVLKEYPILGADSEFAAKAALAARMQGKYRELHMAMMDFKGKVTSDDVRRLAAGVGLDVDRLERDMQSPVVADSISRNLALGEAIGVRGTPAFVIGDELIPGAISVEEMQKRIAVARKTEG